MPPNAETPRTHKDGRRPRRDLDMTAVTIRDQSGTLVMTLHPAILKAIGADTGTTITLAMKDGSLVATAIPAPKRRYTLAELLEGAEHLPALYADTAGAL